MAIFKGAGVAIATPMKENLEVNYDKLDEMLEEQIAGGTDAIVICGTTGESATMTEEEHAATIRFAIERVNHRIPVIAGTGSNCTRTAIQLSKEAQEDGADGLLLVTPYYNKATQNGLIAHYTAICNEVNIPAILYNVPSRTGCGLQPQTVATLVKDVENIVGIKEASGNISTVAQIMHLCDGNVDLYSGNDDQVVPLLALGGIGVISVLSNVAPAYVHDMCYKFFSGDIAGSRKMQLDALPLVDALFCEVNPIPVKAALNMMGKEVGTLRAPLTEMEDVIYDLRRLNKSPEETRTYCARLYLLLAKYTNEHVRETGIVRLLMTSARTDFNGLAAMLRQLLTQWETDRSEKNQASFSSTVQKAMLYVHDHLSDEGLSIAAVAGTVLFIHPDYFGKLFRKETGIAFTRYVMDLRMDRAKKLIAERPDIKVYELCEATGFGENPHYFSQVFRSCCGCTPSEYKRAMGNVK